MPGQVCPCVCVKHITDSSRTLMPTHFDTTRLIICACGAPLSYSLVTTAHSLGHLDLPRVAVHDIAQTMSRCLTAVKPWRIHLGSRLARRSFAGSGGGSGGDGSTPAVNVFDRAAKRRQRDRAAAADWEGDFDYLREHIASALVDRIEVGKP